MGWNDIIYGLLYRNFVPRSELIFGLGDIKFLKCDMLLGIRSSELMIKVLHQDKVQFSSSFSAQYI